MPIYNAQDTVVSAINSVLTQTYENIELIVVDDCSTDASLTLLRDVFTGEKRLRVLRNERNKGVAESLNRAIRHATGEFIARMDSDDFSLPKRLEEQWMYLKKHANIGVLGTSFEFCGARQGKRIMPHRPAENKVNLLFNPCVCHPSVMIRACAMEPYDKTYEGCEDYELWWRLAQKTEISNLSKVLLRYRIHPKQVTQRNTGVVKSNLQKLRQVQLRDILGTYSDRELELLASFGTLSKQPTEELVREFSTFFEKINAAAYYQREKHELRALLKNLLLTLTRGMAYSKERELLKGSSIVAMSDLYLSWLKRNLSRK